MDETDPSGRRRLLRTPVLIITILGVEIFCLAFLYTGQQSRTDPPSNHTTGTSITAPAKADPQRLELPVIQGKFWTHGLGAPQLYQIEVYALIDLAHGDHTTAPAIRNALAKNPEAINELSTQIIGRAHPQWFRESELQTLRRQFHAGLIRLIPDSPPELRRAFTNVILPKLIPGNSDAK